MKDMIIVCWQRRTEKQKWLREKYHWGMDYFHREPYTWRTAGAALLSDILDSKTTEYDEAVLGTFEAYLWSPSVFGPGHVGHQHGETDYESRETVLVVKALRRYQKRGWLRKRPMISLPPRLPFTVLEGVVTPNTAHPHYTRWCEVKGREPEYD